MASTVRLNTGQKVLMSLTFKDENGVQATELPVGASIEWISSDENVTTTEEDEDTGNDLNRWARSGNPGVATITARLTRKDGQQREDTLEVTVAEVELDAVELTVGTQVLES